MDHQKAYDFAIQVLKDELEPYLKYHNLEHTVLVAKDAVELGKKEGVSEEELILLKTAAVFHDIGFIKSYFANEKIGAQIAAEKLPEFGYSQEQISIIEALIMSTVFPGKPVTHLEKIICDADLLYVGSTDFKKIANGLKYEFEHVGIIESEEEWLKLQVDFLTSFNFKTSSAILNAGDGLNQNRIEAIEDYRIFMENKNNKD